MTIWLTVVNRLPLKDQFRQELNFSMVFPIKPENFKNLCRNHDRKVKYTESRTHQLTQNFEKFPPNLDLYPNCFLKMTGWIWNDRLKNTFKRGVNKLPIQNFTNLQHLQHGARKLSNEFNCVVKFRKRLRLNTSDSYTNGEFCKQVSCHKNSTQDYKTTILQAKMLPKLCRLGKTGIYYDQKIGLISVPGDLNMAVASAYTSAVPSRSHAKINHKRKFCPTVLHLYLKQKHTSYCLPCA